MWTYTYSEKARITYGIDALESLADSCESFDANRVVLLTTRSLLGSEPERGVRAALGDRCVAVVADVAQHVPEASVTRLLQDVHKLAPDLIVTLGGGSVTDSAKALSVGLAEGFDSGAALFQHRIRFTYPDKVESLAFTADPLPIIAIPTTLSAAEYDGIFGITSKDSVKELYSNDAAMPKVVILDPQVTTSTPDRLWLGTGIRTLDHAVETYLSRSPTPVTDPLALHAIELIARNLPETRRDPSNLEARLNCLVAGWLSMFGVANVTLGLSHGIGHQIGAYCGVPHGETSCVMLPVVVERIRQARPERLAKVASALGVDVSTMSVAEAADTAPRVIRDLVRGLGLPTTLKDVGVRAEEFPVIARAAMADMVVAFSPIAVTEDEVIQLLMQAS